MVRKKKKSRIKNRKMDGDETESDTQSGKDSSNKRLGTNNKKAEKSAIQILQKKVPKASAVIIKGRTSSFSYADALVKLRKQIPLGETGIHDTKIKKQQTVRFS